MVGNSGGSIFGKTSELLLCGPGPQGFDVVELCPFHGEVMSDFTAAKLTYKIIGYMGKKRGWL